jgi:DNA repair exonuclease SbcCD nuclease subunit
MKIRCEMKNLMVTLICLIPVLAIPKTWATAGLAVKPNQKIDTAKSKETKNELHEGQLLKVDLTPYEKDLENIKKLQRDKVKLTLEKENLDLQKALGDETTDNFKNLINKIYVIDIVLTKKNNLARLYIPGRGITLAKVGDKISDDINIVEIKKNKVVATVQLPDAKKFKNLPFHYGSS